MRTASFASTVTLLEATETNDNRHEGVETLWAIAHRVRTASSASTVPLLEATESHDIRHEGVDGHCQRNDIVDFGIARTQRGLLRTEYTLLEAMESNDNRHEGVDGYC